MTNVSLRDPLNCTKIGHILEASGYKIQLGNLKALLKELGFAYNGRCCSIQQLVAKLKEYVFPDLETQKYQQQAQRAIHNITDDDELLLGIKRREGTHSIIDIIKELFYSVGKPLYQIFREFGNGESMEIKQFIKIVRAYSRDTLAESDIREAF